MIKNLVPLAKLYKDIIFDDGFYDWAEKYEHFSEFIIKDNSKTFLWKMSKSSNKIYIFGNQKYGFGNKIDSASNMGELYYDESIDKIAMIPQKMKETGAPVCETLRIYQKSTKTTIARADVVISGIIDDDECLEGIIEIIEISDDIEVLKNIVSRNTHDIKNQLMLMMAMANNIHNTSENSTIKKYAYFIKDTVYSCNYMLSLLSSDTDSNAENKCNLFNIHHVIPALLESFRCEKNIKFTNKMNADNPRIYANKVLITNVIYNLLINAIQALEHSGGIFIKTYNKNQNPNSDFKCCQWLFIEIKDNGMGIEEKNMDKIFDQFFTTKLNGTGIGLYSARLTLEKYNGTINVSSEKGKGATFVVCLPSHIE